MANIDQASVRIPVGRTHLDGLLILPPNPKGMVIFSHGSGSSRFSPRNQMVARFLNGLHFGTLLFDLLTDMEDIDYSMRFNIPLLTERLVLGTEWLIQQPNTKALPYAFFGASTGAASALKAAAHLPATTAVVSRGGRPDLAMDELHLVNAPTLLIVGSRDHDVLRLNETAYAELPGIKQLSIVEGATHLFEEAGKMEEVCRLAGDWFTKYLF
ncbi:alpha/beta hydrolase [Flavihumibacter rivuli]|uniref:dienelactone hydrolase family protein n=1 Tax=Flavihumibacter rivuli TaxID=2838156 RepID=UPI001BDF0151|nr:alpha/beta hydrolase [Flavihumibacter rivuli]ULQ57755.1 alpha/beta hydrolase [Flavihumibacter rivuli]